MSSVKIQPGSTLAKAFAEKINSDPKDDKITVAEFQNFLKSNDTTVGEGEAKVSFGYFFQDQTDGGVLGELFKGKKEVTVQEFQNNFSNKDR
jgi:hypothetical protein